MGTNKNARKALLKIDSSGTCFHCKARFNQDRLTLEHLIPKRFFGKNIYIALSCDRCNNHWGQINDVYDIFYKRLIEENGISDESLKDLYDFIRRFKRYLNDRAEYVGIIQIFEELYNACYQRCWGEILIFN